MSYAFLRRGLTSLVSFSARSNKVLITLGEIDVDPTQGSHHSEVVGNEMVIFAFRVMPDLENHSTEPTATPPYCRKLFRIVVLLVDEVDLIGVCNCYISG
jgi:hypothetical protein